MDYSIRLSNGQVLRGIIMSPGEKLRAVIIFIHGHGEHIGRYNHLAEYFHNQQIGFTGVDLPGHGRSDGKRGHIRKFSLLYEMTGILVNECSKTFPGIPVILYGHSMGGLIAIDYILKRKPKIKAAVITSPLLRMAFEPGKSKVILATVVKDILPGIAQPSGLQVEYLSHDQGVVERYQNDPLVHDLCSASLFYGFMNAGKQCLMHASELNLPMLIVHGSDDHITSPEASREFASKTSMVELKIWDNGYHELHNETFRQDVLSYIGSWINRQIEKKV